MLSGFQHIRRGDQTLIVFAVQRRDGDPVCSMAEYCVEASECCVSDIRKRVLYKLFQHIDSADGGRSSSCVHSDLPYWVDDGHRD